MPKGLKDVHIVKRYITLEGCIYTYLALRGPLWDSLSALWAYCPEGPTFLSYAQSAYCTFRCWKGIPLWGTFIDEVDGLKAVGPLWGN